MLDINYSSAKTILSQHRQSVKKDAEGIALQNSVPFRKGSSAADEHDSQKNDSECHSHMTVQVMRVGSNSNSAVAQMALADDKKDDAPELIGGTSTETAVKKRDLTGDEAERAQIGTEGRTKKKEKREVNGIC
jgi:hypothetical protein